MQDALVLNVHLLHNKKIINLNYIKMKNKKLLSKDVLDKIRGGKSIDPLFTPVSSGAAALCLFSCEYKGCKDGCIGGCQTGGFAPCQ